MGFLTEDKQMSSTVTFVTGNANKLAEVTAILSKDTIPYTLVNAPLDLDEIQGSIEEVTTHKTVQAAKLINGPVLVEDTCLSFTALNGLPGPYIKWFVKSLGLENLIKMLDGFQDKSATAITTFGFCQGPDHPVLLFQGQTQGTIVSVPQGPRNFGWDAIFMPANYDVTYAAMEKSEKNKISQRSKALEKLKLHFKTN